MHIARTPSVQCACTAPRSSASHLFNMENDWARSSLHLNKYMIPAFAFCNFGKWRTFGGSGGVGSGTILMLPTIIKYINTNKHHHITQKHTERETICAVDAWFVIRTERNFIDCLRISKWIFFPMCGKSDPPENGFLWGKNTNCSFFSPKQWRSW